MRRFLLFPFWLLAMKNGFGQGDSIAAIYINSIIREIDGRLPADVLEKTDTTIYDNDSSKNSWMTVHTDYYIESRSGQVEKIVERTKYKTWTTALVVYYRRGQPLLFRNTQWQGIKLKFDFDIYYMNGNPVYFIKRDENKGRPDGDFFLKWCYELLKDYKPGPP